MHVQHQPAFDAESVFARLLPTGLNALDGNPKPYRCIICHCECKVRTWRGRVCQFTLNGSRAPETGHPMARSPRLWRSEAMPERRFRSRKDWSDSCNTKGELPTLPTGENTIHEVHRKAAEQHELAARAHRTAAEHNEKGHSTAAIWHSERALEYSDHAFKLAKEAHNKSGEIVSL